MPLRSRVSFVRRSAALAVAAVVLSTGQALPARADDDPPPPPPPPPAAAGTELVEKRTAYAKTFATENPLEYRSEIHSRPIHFLDATGAWADIDTSLVRGTDNKFHAKANSLGLEIPTTSTGSLATVSVDGTHSVGFGLTGAAAVPATVSGTTATFAGLLGGSSLRLTSHYNGVKEDIVLASRLAPSTYVFPLYLEGLTAHLDSEGNVLYKDATGTERARTPHGRMNDSAVDPHSGDPASSDAVTYALLPVGPTGIALQVTADPLWLASPARAYPVTIDPSVYAAGSDDTFVESPYTNDYSTDVLLKNGTFNGGANKARSFIHFAGANALDGKVINSATIQVYENWSYSCTASQVDLYQVSQSWSGTGLHSYPGFSLGTKIDSDVSAHGYTGCADAWVTFSATTAMRNWASNTWVNNGVALRAPDELNSYQWKKWDSAQTANDPKLTVDWSEPNRAPGQVSGRTVTPKACATCSPTVTNDATPVLTGTATDADGDVLRYDFEVYSGWLTAVDSSGNATPGSATRSAYGSVSNKASGTQGAWTVTPSLGDGKYSYRVRAYDGAAYGLWSSGWVQFTVDATLPAAPTVTSSSHPVSGGWYPSSNLAFAWSATSESGIAGYSYVLDQVSATVPDTTSEGTATSVSYPGKADGLWYFHVRALNNAGGWSTTKTYAAGVDVTAPPAVTGLVSTDHTASIPSADRTISFSWNAVTDAASGLAGYSWAVNGSSATAADTTVDTTLTSAATASLADGTWWVHVRAVDAAGNAGPDVAIGPFPIDAAGPLAPVVTSLDHASNVWSPSRTATFSWTTPADATPITGYSVSFDASATADPDTIVDTVLAAWTQSGIADGEWWLHVRAVDAAGNWGATTHYRVRVDGTAPLPPALSSQTHPDSGAWYRTVSPVVDVAVSDISGITGYSVSYDHDQLGTPDGTVDTTTAPISLGALPDGIWWVHVKALNGASLWSPTGSYLVQVDAGAPPLPAPVTSTTHDTVDPTNQRAVTVSWPAVTDPTSGLVGYSYAFTNSATWTAPSSVDTTANSVTSAELADGTWYFHVAALDAAGNLSGVAHFGPVTIGGAAPPVGATSTQRFLDLWQPRLNDTYAVDYLASPVYSSEILAEGFHSLNSVQKQYLAGKLYDLVIPGWIAAMDGFDDPDTLAVMKEDIYKYVFSKELLIGLTGMPSRLIAAASELLEAVAPQIPQEYLTAIDTTILDHVAELLPDVDLPEPVDDLVEPEIDAIVDPTLSDVTSALSSGVQDTLNQVDSLVEDNYPEVMNQVNQVIADAGLTPVADAVYSVAALLPVSPFYAVCWESPTGQACQENNVVGTPAAVDTTGDGTLDVTATFSAGSVDLTAPTELPFVVEVHRRTGSDRDGKALQAHVWISYDIPAAGQRILVGVDGLRRAATLPDVADVEYRFRDLATLQSGRPNGRYTLTTSGGAATAITFGVRELNQSTPNTVEGTVQLTPAPETLRGTVDIADSTLNGTTTSELHLSTTLPVGSPGVAVDGTLAINHPRDNNRVTHHAVVDKIPAGTTYVDVTRTTSSAGRQGLVVDTDAPGSISRVTYGLSSVNGTTKTGVTADVRGLPPITQTKANWGGGGGVDGQYAGGPLTRVGLAITNDVDNVRQLNVAARATDVPGVVQFDYGTNADKSVTTVNYSGSSVLGTLALAFYDRAKVITLAATMASVPRTVTASFSKTNKSADVTTDGILGSLTGTLTVDGGRIYKATPEHVTVQLATANGVTGIGVSAKVTGLRSMSGAFGDTSTVHGSFAPGGQRLLLLGRLDALYAVADLAQTPATFDATLDRPGLHAHYTGATQVSGLSLYIARRPGGPIVDATLTTVPTEVDVVGTLGADPSVTYSAASRMGAAHVMFSSDATPTDGSGTTFTADLTDLPTDVHFEMHPNDRSFSATSPGVIGSTLVTFSRNRGKAEVPAGEHATLYINGTKDAGSVRIRNLKTMSGSFDTNGTSTATIDVSSGGRPFAVSASIGTLRIAGTIGALPTHTTFTLEGKTHLRWDASQTVSSLSFYKTTTGTGPTLWVSGKTIPRVIDITGSTSPTFHVVYDSEQTGSAAELKATYAPTYVNGPVPPKTGRYGSVTIHGVPNTVTVDVKSDLSHVDWNADGTTTDLSFAVRGLPSPGFSANGKLTGVPRHWSADRRAKVMGVTAYDNAEIATAEVGFSNNGEIKTMPGYHVRFHGSEFPSKFNTHIKAAHVRDVTIDTATGLYAHSEVDLGGAEFRLDVDSTGAAPDTTGGTTDEFRTYVNGVVSNLPAELTVTASKSSIVWDASEQLNANAEIRYGWVPAVTNAPKPANVWGVGITDGTASSSSTCRPAAGRTLADANECFGLRVKYNYQGLGKKVTVTMPLSTGGVVITNMRPPASRNWFTADLKLAHLASVVGNVTQEGIPQGVTLDFGPFEFKSPAGSNVALHVGTNHTADLGSLHGEVSLPGLTKSLGNITLSQIRGTFNVSSTPRRFDLQVEHGTPGKGIVDLSSPITSIRAQVFAKANGADANAVLKLEDLPATPGTQKITVTIDQPTEASKPTGGAENPEIPKMPDPEPCEQSSSSGSGEVADGHSNDSKHKGIEALPVIHFKSPPRAIGARGVTVSVDTSGPIAQAAGGTFEAHDVHLALKGLGATLDASLYSKNRLTTISSPDGRLAELWALASFGIVVPCHTFQVPDIKSGPAKVVINGRYDLRIDSATVEVSLRDVQNVILKTGSTYLAYGVEGTYGAVDVGIYNLVMKSDSMLHVTIYKRPFDWLPKFYDKKIEIKGTFTTLKPSLYRQNATDEDIGGSFDVSSGPVPVVCLVMVGKPVYRGYTTGGVSFRNNEAGVFSILSGQLASDSEEREDLQVFINAGIAKALSPSDHKMDMEKRDWAQGC